MRDIAVASQVAEPEVGENELYFLSDNRAGTHCLK